MQYITQINAFERWLEANRLSSVAQLLWYKLMYRFSRCGWTEWISVDNRRLMCAIEVSREDSLIRARNELIQNDLIVYQRGKKGSPGRYKMQELTFKYEVQSVGNIVVKPENENCTFKYGVKNVVETVVQTGGKSVAETVDINRQRQRLRQRQKEEENSNEFPSSGGSDFSEPVISLVLKTGEEYPVCQAQVEQWEELYPSVDVMQELHAMKGWLDSNPRKRPTEAGILRFVTNWLKKEQKQISGKSGNGSVLFDAIMQKQFSEFWDKYPRKIAQGAAEEAWSNIHPDKELFDQIMDALWDAIYSKQWQEEQGRFIPSPAKWLKEKRWNDKQTIQIPESPNEKRTYDLQAYEEMDFLEPFPEFGG